MVDLDLKELAYRQVQRVFVEKIVEEGKNQVGMGDYQVKSWNGFHKHLVLCFIGLCYMLYQKRKPKEKIHPTAPIIRKLVASEIKSKWDHLNSAISLAKTQLKRYWDSNLYKINYQLVIYQSRIRYLTKSYSNRIVK